MILRHAALTCSSEKNSDKFYESLLGLKKSESKTLPPALAKAIFGVDSELQITNYLNANVHFEVFISSHLIKDARPINHICLEVDDLQSFLKKCDKLEIDVSQIPKGSSILTFIRDFDGNLFEIK